MQGQAAEEERIASIAQAQAMNRYKAAQKKAEDDEKREMEKRVRAKIERMKRAAEMEEDSHAAYKLGRIYESGREVEQDYDTAADWYEKAAEMGHHDAQFNLAVMYDEGRGVMQSAATAYKYYEEVAKTGDYHSQIAMKRLEKDM